METLSSLTDVINQFNQHPNSTRIKKLIFCICKNRWENDTQKIIEFPLDSLLSDLLQLYPTLSELTLKLNQVVGSLNKPAEYGVLAKIITEKLHPFYPSNLDIYTTNPEEPTQMLASLGSLPSPPSAPDSSTRLATKPPYDPFDLRLELMRYTNPLRAKILIFSTLYYPFNFKQQDWLALKTIELDDLLFSLFCQCQTLNDLEIQLCKTAKILDESNEAMQAASAIIRTLEPSYSKRNLDWIYQNDASINLGELLKQKQESLTDSSSESDEDFDDNDTGEETCQFFPA